MTPTRSIRAALIMIAALIVMTGCFYPGGTMTNPGDDVLSPPNGLSTKTQDQLLDDTLEQVNDLVQLMGGEWLDDGVPPRVFDPINRAGWALQACDMPATSEQYSITVWQDAAPGSPIDPYPPVAKVRAYWEKLGYTIRQIGPPSQDVTKGHSIIVDLPRKAGLSFFASTEVLGISAYSECGKWD
ncbi:MULTISPECIES: hypothetical protein [unclassified Leifsonia]|uniref:hypothetical protein n=1 Tax=unclassified Leifsonia TaxID=2663824 RepID=UPI0008A80174|nr:MULTISPECIES: hypothetical protein [unclassified Leifsonia]SEH74421.1 hypothetical protein SAMN04515694_103140 [Leifsonia sp. CL154]SFL35972.1 hypothetical protein SAMN04515692_103141 [Leifsonia sp. CL147]